MLPTTFYLAEGFLDFPERLWTWHAGSQMVLQTFSGKGAPPSETVLQFDFQLRRWYHVVVAHAPGGPLSTPIATLYVDGELAATAEKLRYPKVGLSCVVKRGTFHE